MLNKSKMNFNPLSGSEFTDKLSAIVEANLRDPQFGVSLLAQKMGMSRSNLHRKVKAITNISVSQFIRQIRLEKALVMLKQSEKPAAEVADNVGFGSATYFSKCFHDYFGYTPGEVGRITHNMAVTTSLPNPPSTSNKKLYTIAVFFFLIVCLQFVIIYYVFKPFSFIDNNEIKTIVVLPITNYNSSNTENLSLFNALREDLISKLEIIDNLHVISQLNSEVLPGNQGNEKEISKVYEANYILEGTWQELEQTIKVQFQLIDTKNYKYLWSKPFVREITDNNLLSFQDEIALLVVNELNSLVSKKEKEQILTVQTHNLAAYNHYLQGKNFMEVYKQMPGSNFTNTDAKYFVPLELARSSFEKALKLDSAYAQVYVELGWYYHTKSEVFIFEAEKSDNYLDSALLMAEKALSFNSDLADGYDLQSCIFAHKGNSSKSLEASDKLIGFNQNNWKAYYRVADNYKLMNMYSRATRYYLLARELNISPLEDINTIKGLQSCLLETGFTEEAKLLVELLLTQENDSIDYFSSLSYIEFSLGNLDQAINYQLKAYTLNSSNSERLLILSLFYLTASNPDKMHEYFNKYKIHIKRESSKITPNKYAGYIYFLQGDETNSRYHFNRVLKSNEKRLELKTSNHFSFSSAYEMACIYSATGESKKAIELLNEYKNENSCPLWLITSLGNNPMLDKLRNTKDFQNLIEDLSKIFNAERIKTEKIISQEETIQT